MWLDCGPYGKVKLERITPKSVVAKDSHEIPPCDAEIVVTVDGQFVRNQVMLTSGFSNGRRAARVQPRNDSYPL